MGAHLLSAPFWTPTFGWIFGLSEGATKGPSLVTSEKQIRQSAATEISESERLSRALGTIYDAALDPTFWVAALEQSCLYLNCMAGVLGAYDILVRGVGMSAAWGFKPGYIENLDSMMRINPLARAAFKVKAGDFGSASEAIPLAELYATEVFRVWAKPQGIIDVVQATLDRTPMAMAVAGFSRHESQGLVDDVLRHRMRLITPHLRRAILVGKTIDLARLEAHTLAGTLDGLAAGVFLVDETGRLIHANQSGLAILAEADFLRDAEGTLRAADPKADRTLRDAFASSLRGDPAWAPRRRAEAYFAVGSPM